VANHVWRIKAGSAIVDGEIVAPAADGSIDFSVLQNELKGSSTRNVLIAFDLLYLNGRDTRKEPLVRRKAQLKKIVAGTDVQFSESFEIEGRAMFAHACKVGLEGVVSKVADSAYASGCGNNWVKKTCAGRETLTIAGFALDECNLDGIYLGRRKDNDLVYAGKVDHGDEASTPLCRNSSTTDPQVHLAFLAAAASRSSWKQTELNRAPATSNHHRSSSKGRKSIPYRTVPPGSSAIDKVHSWRIGQMLFRIGNRHGAAAASRLLRKRLIALMRQEAERRIAT
jgi:hypothetical protein